MKVIEARNPHQALALGLNYLFKDGVQRDSRNGPVLQSPTPVTTVYQRPMERVVFWSQRDANPFFHLYEAMWMLSGRNDADGVARYAKQMRSYSDDGKTINGSAYGYRWRQMFSPTDQLVEVVRMLREDPNNRRVMLQMWDASCDLGSTSKDVPCNTMASVQINTEGALDLTVFCRSNDIVWGAYGANAVHFSVLLEYLAACIGVSVGRYYQVSINWHGYLATIEPLRVLGDQSWSQSDPYVMGLCQPVPLMTPYYRGDSLIPVSMEWFDFNLLQVMTLVDGESLTFGGAEIWKPFPFFHTFYIMMMAHETWRQQRGNPARYQMALDVLALGEPSVDWIRAGKEWMMRRQVKEANANPQQA